MAKRAPDAQPLGRASLLPGLRAYDDLAGVAGAWQTVVDRAKVQAHLAKGGRVHLAVEDRWMIAYPAAIPQILPEVPAYVDGQVDPEARWTDAPSHRNAGCNPRPFGIQEAIAQGLVYMPSPRFEPPC